MRLFTIVALLLASTAVQAAEKDCNDATNQNDMNICVEDGYKAADKALNDAWNRLSGADKDRLRDEERAWIKRRDSDCKASAAENEGGSIYPTVYFGCMAEKTKARTRTLRAIK